MYVLEQSYEYIVIPCFLVYSSAFCWRHNELSGPVTCADYEFRCTDGQCINARSRCDGYGDCADQSDESGCGTWTLIFAHIIFQPCSVTVFHSNTIVQYVCDAVFTRFSRLSTFESHFLWFYIRLKIAMRVSFDATMGVVSTPDGAVIAIRIVGIALMKPIVVQSSATST